MKRSPYSQNIEHAIVCFSSRTKLFLFLIAIIPFWLTSVRAEPKGFVCKSSKWGDSNISINYVAVAIMRSGAEKPFIPFLANTNMSLEERCRIVVDRLNAANASGRLRYLTWGTDSKNGQYLCSVSRLGEICSEILLQISRNKPGDTAIAELGRPNQDAIRYRDSRAYLDVSILLDPTGSECGVGYQLKDSLCEKKPDPPCSDGAARGSDGQCLCPSGKFKNEYGGCIAPVCGEGTILGSDGVSCVVPTYPKTPTIICPTGWGQTPSGCMPVLCPIGMSPSLTGCVPTMQPTPAPYVPKTCPPGMPPFLCTLIMPRG